jgi:predicted AlkP superfamily pyrophosphatase or phosphodiesterase
MVDPDHGGKKLVVLHIDGLGADTLEQALRDGKMPHLRRLIEDEGYEIHRYRCGLPSTTPFAQAGILYGDNSEIPCFRWWDRERRVLVQFGTRSTFKKVAANTSRAPGR